MSDRPPNYYIYCVSSELTDRNGLKKLGLTIHPQHRLRQYAIGDAPGCGLEKKYDSLWRIDVESRAELREMEHILHTHFADRRQGTTEWFKVTYGEVTAFMTSPQKFNVQQVSFDEIKMINTKFREPLTASEKGLYEEEEALQKEKSEIPVKDVLYEKFLRVFLAGKQPRRVQIELWNLFTALCATPDRLLYRGIVQWPTGVGKTIATLMLIVIAAERCKRRGEFYRGLFVSPKNDILDTISKDFNKLSEFSITVYDGSHGKLSALTIPTNSHILISACQASLINDKGMRRLPHMTHVHYDEVHRITGELYFQLLKEMLIKWSTEILTGTSATPFTSNPSQRKKITELFDDPLTLLHRCGVDEAVMEGWIAKPRFIVCVIPPIDDTDAHLRGFVEAVAKYILLKNTDGKFICYIETSMDDVSKAASIAKQILPWAKVYSAVDGERTDGAFIRAAIDSTPKILFACQRYREGADIRGIEMTAKLLGNTSAAYILLQICGRAGRIDENKDKEGWCLLVRPSEKGTSEQEVLDTILLDVLEFMGKSDKPLTKNEIERMLRAYLGDISLNGSSCSINETIERVQAAYVRKEYAKRTPKEKYSLVRQENKDLNLKSRDEYRERQSEHPTYIEDPQSYFKDWWVSWYHFLGVDTSAFPQTKPEWVRVCKDRGITTWDEYKTLGNDDMPKNPIEMYEDFTNWDTEIGVEEEIVW